MFRACLLFVSASLALSAQSASQKAEPAFDVVSVKLNTATAGPRFINPMAGGRFTVTRMPLAEIVRFAWHLEGVNSRIVGLPSWSSSTFYDVSASMPARFVQADGMVTLDDVRAMTRTLLKDRFALAAHMETRVVPTYTLVKSRADGRLGWRLRPSGDVCPPITLPAGLPMPPPPPPPPGAQGPPISIDCVGFSVGGHMFLRRAPMDRFADSLAIFVQRTVVNGTALDGAFDIDLDYAPDPAITQQNAARGPGAPPAPGPDANIPELFTALEEQLGLKLEATRGPVDTLVVDSIARPTDD